jgi:hypothetical protein
MTDFKELCKYLYGGGWQTALARDLSVNLRTVKRWALGEYNVPQVVMQEVYILVAAKQLKELLPVLEGIAKKHGLPAEIELKVSGSDQKVESVHYRPWSASADLEIKKIIAAELNQSGIPAFVKNI